MPGTVQDGGKSKMKMTSLLSKNSQPSEKEVFNKQIIAMQSNICNS